MLRSSVLLCSSPVIEYNRGDCWEIFPDNYVALLNKKDNNVTQSDVNNEAKRGALY